MVPKEIQVVQIIPKEIPAFALQNKLFFRKYMCLLHETKHSLGNAQITIMKPIIPKEFQVFTSQSQLFLRKYNDFRHTVNKTYVKPMIPIRNLRTRKENK